MFELGLGIIITLVICAFLCEYLDSTLGMGYGTTLTPVFMLMGFKPMQIVPAILLSELISGLLAGILHHREGNVDFRPKTVYILKITEMLRSLGYIETVRKTNIGHDMKRKLLDLYDGYYYYFFCFFTDAVCEDNI